MFGRTAPGRDAGVSVVFIRVSGVIVVGVDEAGAAEKGGVVNHGAPIVEAQSRTVRFWRGRRGGGGGARALRGAQIAFFERRGRRLGVMDGMRVGIGQGRVIVVDGGVVTGAGESDEPSGGDDGGDHGQSRRQCQQHPNQRTTSHDHVTHFSCFCLCLKEMIRIFVGFFVCVCVLFILFSVLFASFSLGLSGFFL